MVLKFKSLVEEFGAASKGVLHRLSAKVLVPWKPPYAGRLTINVDDLIGGGLCAWAMIVRNHVGKLVLFASRC